MSAQSPKPARGRTRLSMRTHTALSAYETGLFAARPESMFLCMRAHHDIEEPFRQRWMTKLMKSIVSRLITIICLGALAAVLAACGGSAAADLPMTPMPAPTSSAPTEQPAPPTSAPKPTDAPTVAPTAKPAAVASKPTSLPTAKPEPSGSTVAIKLSAFSPAKLEVRVGTTVVWTNYDEVAHTVTGGAPPSFGDPFGSDFLRQGQSFSFAFDQLGEYPYYCAPHEQMLGVVKVVAQ